MQGAYSRFAKALDWANSAGLKVMIDVHGGMLFYSTVFVYMS